MKKFLTIVIAVLLAVSCMALVACNKDGDGDTDPNLGVYHLVSITQGDNVMTNLAELGIAVYDIELKADGVVTFNMESVNGETEDYTGTWSLDGTALSMLIDEQTVLGTLSDGSLSFTMGYSTYSFNK